jgi:hypothetical protein
MNKIKEYANYVLGLLLLIVSALFFRKKMQNEELQSELSKEKTNAEIKDNESDRLAAKQHADALVDEYEKLRGDDR